MTGDPAKLIVAIERLTGMQIQEDKLYLLEGRLSDILKGAGIDTYDEAAVKLDLEPDSDFTNSIIDKITTHETRFFRDESIFDALVAQIVPEWLEKRGMKIKDASSAQLKIWSAGCSTGQEAYSVIMMLKEKIPGIVNNLQVYGTDIGAETLEKARAGLYSKFEVDRGVPPHLLNKYFDQEGDRYRIKSDVRDHVKFDHLNLVTDRYPTGFDIIMCRNVAIYFPDPLRRTVYEKIRQAANKDGVIILGSAESLNGYIENFIVREFGLSRYYEVNASQVTLF